MAKTTSPPVRESKPATIGAQSFLTSLDAEEIETKVAELEQQKAEIDREIDAYRVLARAAHILKHGKPPRKKPERKAQPVGGTGGNGNGQAEAPKQPLAQRILAYLERAGRAKNAVIANDLGTSEAYTSQTMQQLRDKGLVSRDLDGSYRLAKKDEE